MCHRSGEISGFGGNLLLQAPSDSALVLWVRSSWENTGESWDDIEKSHTRTHTNANKQTNKRTNELIHKRTKEHKIKECVTYISEFPPRHDCCFRIRCERSISISYFLIMRCVASCDFVRNPLIEYCTTVLSNTHPMCMWDISF